MEVLVTDLKVLYEIQRSLGRIEGAQLQLKEEVRSGLLGLREELSHHKQDDQRNFSSMRLALAERMDERERKNAMYEAHMANIDLAVQKLELQDEQSRRIGIYILGLLGSLASFVGAAVLAWFKGYIKVN